MSLHRNLLTARFASSTCLACQALFVVSGLEFGKAATLLCWGAVLAVWAVLPEASRPRRLHSICRLPITRVEGRFVSCLCSIPLHPLDQPTKIVKHPFVPLVIAQHYG